MNSGMHIEERQTHHFVGTASFSSVYSHRMMQQSRRDDIESLGNVLVFLKKGRLPWLRVKISSKMTRKQKYDLITKKKLETSFEDITRKLPPEFKNFYVYCR